MVQPFQIPGSELVYFREIFPDTGDVLQELPCTAINVSLDVIVVSATCLESRVLNVESNSSDFISLGKRAEKIWLVLLAL